MDQTVSTRVSHDTRVPAFITPQITLHCWACGGVSPYHRAQGCAYCHPDCHRWHVPLWFVRFGQRLRGLWPF